MAADIENAAKLAQETDWPTPQWTQAQCSPTQDVSSITQRAINVYMASKKPNGGMGGVGWWQCANGYTAMALHDLWSGTTTNYDNLATAIRTCESRQAGLINVFNDDTCWWALLCVHMYSLRGERWFLEKAKGIWRAIRQSESFCRRGKVLFQGKDMEGAVYWTKKPKEVHINAISTGLFAELSARLALIEMRGEGGDGGGSLSGVLSQLKDAVRHHHAPSGEGAAQEFLEDARCSLGWVLRCRYRPRKGVVLDHLDLAKEKAVDWTFTYNTGVALGTCALLYEATGQDEYMTLACHMAHRAMTHKGWVEEDGVLTEKGAYGKGKSDPFKPSDSVGFKSVLMRQLGTLYEVLLRTSCPHPKATETKEMIKKFVQINFQSQQERNTNGKGQYGPWWAGPFEHPTSHSQMAALDVMAAAALVNRA